MHHFVVITQQRSGSSLLRQLLNAHPAIHCNPEPQTTDLHHYGVAWAYAQGWTWPQAKRPTVVGFVSKLHQDLHRTIPARSDLRLLLLHRQNRLATLLSYKVAQQIGGGEAPEHGILTLDEAVARRQGLPPVTIPVAEAEGFFEGWTAKTEEVLQCLAGTAWREVVYEELCRDAGAAMAPVYAHLGVAAPPEQQLREGPGRKLDPRPLAAAIVNYGELHAYFRHTRWASFFEEASGVSGASA